MTGPRNMSFRARVGMIALAALAVRVAYVLGPTRHVTGLGDSYFFHWGANLIADGHWFVEPYEHEMFGRLIPSAGHPPLWELVLAGFSWLGGTSYLAHRLLGCVVGALTVVLIGFLGRRLGGDRTGLVAAAIAAAYPIFIAAGGSLMSEGLYLLILTATLLVAFRLCDGPDARSAAGLGALVGLAALTRSEALALVPLLVLPIVLTRPAGRWRLAGIAVLATAIVLAPWTIRNWTEWGRPVLISTNDGTLLAGANCDAAYHGPDVGFWNLDCISERSTDNEAEQEARWRREALGYAKHHSGRLPGVLVVRVMRTWDLYQPRRMAQFTEGRWRPGNEAGVVAYFLLLLLAVGGAWLLRGRRGDLLILLVPVTLVFLVSLTAYGLPRFRAPAEITIVLLAAVSVTRLLERRRPSGR